MRITFVLDSFGGGGKERRCLQLIQGLNKLGYEDIQIIIINNDIAYPELYKTKADLQIIDRKNRKLSFYRTNKIIIKHLKKFQPDIVQVWGVYSSIYLNIIRCIIPFKYIGAYVADCNKLKNFSILGLTVYFNTLLADYIVGNSLAGLKAYGIPLNKWKVIYNGFNNDRLNYSKKKGSLRSELKLKSKYVVSMIARFTDDKDYETFIEAAKIILIKRDDVSFLCVGDGPNLEYFRNKIFKEGKEQIRTLGFRRDVENIIDNSDLSILCSNPNKHKEGISNSILESMAFGIPVIATNDGGTVEIIESNYNGFLVEAFNSEILAIKILDLLDDKELYKKMSKNARKTVSEKFSLPKMTNNFVELYNSMLLNKHI